MKLTFVAVCVVGLCFLAGGCRPRKGSLEDPCSFLRPAEIQEFVGVPVAEGKIVPRVETITLDGNTGKTTREASRDQMCEYTASGADKDMVAFGAVHVLIYPAAEYEKDRAASYTCGVCKAGGRCRDVKVSPVPVAGVGEGAFWFTPPPDTAEETLNFSCGASAHFAALDITHAIRIDLPFVRTGVDAKTASIELAKKAMPRFPIPHVPVR
jgi:hypothetical protein